MLGAPSSVLVFSNEVKNAFQTGQGIVALESTIISHGMPYPQNVETARQVENTIREGGACPATIALMDGKIKIGLNDDDLELLAKTGRKALKVSRRDIAIVLSKGIVGATTVAATMYCAHMAGIGVFVTGGIGGVSRAPLEYDISADLTELGQTPVTVICAGVKSILDINRTLEYLETQGVPVIGFGSDEVPAFFTRKSGFKPSVRLDTSMEVARAHIASQSVKMGSGMLVTVPVPKDQEGDAESIEIAIQQSLREAREKGQIGRLLTPYVLQRVNELTQGKSLKANVALVLNNAKVGAAIARDIASRNSESQPKTGGAVVIGGIVSDIVGRPNKTLRMEVGWELDSTMNRRETNIYLQKKNIAHHVYAPQQDSNIGKVIASTGGVAANVATAAARTGTATELISVVGADGHGSQGCSQIEVIPDGRTAVYSAVLNHLGDMKTAIADMDIFDRITPEFVGRIDRKWGVISKARLVAIDGNLLPSTIEYIARKCQKAGIPTLFEPTSVDKAMRATKSGVLPLFNYIKPNLMEAQHMAMNLGASSPIGSPTMVAKALLKFGVQNAIMSCGADGVIIASNQGLNSLKALKPRRIVNATGAGDSMVGTVISGLIRGLPLTQAVSAGLTASKLSLESNQAVSKELSPRVFNASKL